MRIIGMTFKAKKHEVIIKKNIYRCSPIITIIKRDKRDLTKFNARDYKGGIRQYYVDQNEGSITYHDLKKYYEIDLNIPLRKT